MVAISDIVFSPTNTIIPIRPSAIATGFGQTSRISRRYYIPCDCDGNIDDSGLKALPNQVEMPCSGGLILDKNPNVNITEESSKYCVAEVIWDVAENRFAVQEKVPGELLSVNFGSQSRQANTRYAQATGCFDSSGNDTLTFGEIIVEFDADGNCRESTCPITLSSTQFCEVYCVSKDFVNKAYCESIDLSIGTINLNPFRDCLPCSVMLTSVQGTRPNLESDWTFTFCFAKRQFRIITFNFFDGFLTDDPDVCDPKPLVPRDILIGGFDHVMPRTHTFDCIQEEFEGFEKFVALQKLTVHNPHLKTDFATNLGVPP